MKAKPKEFLMPDEKKNRYRITGLDASGAEWSNTYETWNIQIAQEMFLKDFSAVEITRTVRIN